MTGAFAGRGQLTIKLWNQALHLGSVFGTQLNNENKNRTVQKPEAGWIMPQEGAGKAVFGDGGGEVTASPPLPGSCSGLKCIFLYI